MKFGYNKLFSGGKQKTVVGLEALSRVFDNTGFWSPTENLEQYEKSLYVFAAINKIATKVATIDLKLFQILNVHGDTKEIMNHEILNLLYKVNPFQTRTEFLKSTWINKKLTGEAFWLKVRDGKGNVIELWNLRPDLMTIISDPQKYIVRYEFSKPLGGKEMFDPEDIIHFKDPDPLHPFRGMSPLKSARSRIETEHHATNFQRNFFLNSARPDALLVTSETLDGEQRAQMLDAWDEKHQGDDKTSKVGILEGGMTYQQISISQKEMDFIESLKFTRDDILVALGVPKSVITTDDINMNNSFTGFRVFLSETVSPEMKQMCEVLNEMLVSPDFGEQYYLDYIDPTPSDLATQRQDNLAGYGKWLTTNEIRATYDLPPIKGGDVINVPAPSGFGAFGVNTPIASETPTPGATDPNNEIANISNEGKTFNVGHKGLVLSPFMKGAHVFKNRPMLLKKFELKELIKKELMLSLVKEKKIIRQKKGKQEGSVIDAITKKGKSLFRSKDMRNTYANAINKKIDASAATFAIDIAKAVDMQQVRFMKALFGSEKMKGNALKEKINTGDITGAFNKVKEVRTFTKIALPFLQDTAITAGQDAIDLVGADVKFEMSAVLKAALLARAKFFAEAMNETTFSKLIDTLTAGIDAGEGVGALSDRVTSVYDQFSDYRSDMIARTEATAANAKGALEGYKQSDVVDGKEWVTAEDDKVRDSHASQDGDIIALDDTFANGLTQPGDGDDASETINCRCVIAPAILADSSKSMLDARKKVLDDTKSA